MSSPLPDRISSGVVLPIVEGPAVDEVAISEGGSDPSICPRAECLIYDVADQHNIALRRLAPDSDIVQKIAPSALRQAARRHGVIDRRTGQLACGDDLQRLCERGGSCALRKMLDLPDTHQITGDNSQ